jgi:hypothetical protein
MKSADGGMSKAAGELLEEMQRAQLEAQEQQQKQGVGGASFAQTLEATAPATAPQGVAPSSNAISVLQAAKAEAALPSTRVGAAEQAKESQLWKIVKGVVSGQDKMTQIVNQALSGRSFDPQELLVMQAGVYRFAQELELSSKVVEKMTSGVKQTMNTQV